MFEKQKQEVAGQGTAIQAGGNVTIGLSYSEVKEIVYDLFKQNFPSLVEEASSKARENLFEYEKQLDEAIKRKIDEIDLSKFKDPNTQYLLNSTINQAARKGTSVDLGLLSETLIASLGKENTEFLNVVSEQAIEIIPKLTSNNIKILTLVHYLIYTGLQGLPNISFAEKNNAIVHDLVKGIPKEISSQLNYLASLGVLTVNQFQGIDPFEAIKQQYEYLYKDFDIEKVNKDIRLKSPSLFNMAELYNESELRVATLTPVGMLIALINLRRIFPKIDYKVWIK